MMKIIKLLLVLLLAFSSAQAAESENFALGKPVKASSAQSEVYGPLPVTDGKIENGPGAIWVSQGTSPQSPQWLALDLGAEETFNVIKIWNSGNNTAIDGGRFHYAPKRGRLEGSNFSAAWMRPDRDAYWSEIAEFSFPNVGQGPCELQFAPVSYRYLRLVITESWVTGSNVQISEWQVGFDPSLGLKLSTTRPGNVFTLGEQIQINVQTFLTAQSLSWRLVDAYRNAEVAKGETALDGKSASDHLLELPITEPGYYQLQVAAVDGSETNATASLLLGVVRPQSKASREGPFASDAAIGWLVDPASWDDISEMMQLAGIEWIRDRISWGEVEPQRGKFNWGKYEKSVNAQASRGVKISMVFHSAPDWAKDPGHKLPTPEAMYHFAYEAGKHFAGRIQAWEIWNEVDWSYTESADTPAYYAAVLKAAYLGFKAADPDVLVILNGWASSPRMLLTDYILQTMENQISGYYDAYNFHSHTQRNGQFFVGRIAAHQEIVDKYAPGKPAWLTEAGVALPGENLVALTEEEQRIQAEFIVKSSVLSVANGVDKHFFFVLPHYVESANGMWGILRPDLTPYPAYIALANLNETLKGARYTGKLADVSPEIENYVFETDWGLVAVVWSEEGVKLPGTWRVRSLLGREQQVETLFLNKEPVFLLDLAPQQVELEKQAEIQAQPEPASRVIPILEAELEYNRGRGGYLVKEDERFSATLTLCNLKGEEVRGTATLKLPDGWQLEPARHSIRIPQGGTARYTFWIQPGEIAEALLLRSQIELEGEASTNSALVVLPEIIPIRERHIIAESMVAENWHNNISGGGKLVLTEEPDGILAFNYDFQRGGWAFPRLIFKPEKDWRLWQGLVFKVRVVDCPQTQLRLFVVADDDGIPQNGEPMFYTEIGYHLEEEAGWYEIRLPFDELKHWDGSPPPLDGKLDLGKIGWLSVGVNHSAGGKVRIELSELSLYR